MKNNELDARIRERVKEEFEKTPSPSLTKDQIWENIQQRMAEESDLPKTPGLSRYFKWIGMAAAVLIIIMGISMFQSQNGSAFGWVKDFFLVKDGSSTQLKGSITEPGSHPESQPPLPDPSEIKRLDIKITEKKMSLSEAKSATNFQIAVPEEIPDGVVLQNVTVWFRGDHEKSHKIKLHYVQDGKKVFTIKEDYIQGEMGFSTVVDNEDTEIKQVSINGEKGTLFLFKDDAKRLTWFRMKTHYVIRSESSQISEKEILSIARSM